MAASAITRLPANLRSRALQRISRHANAPGGSNRQIMAPTGTIPRAQRAALSRLQSALGIFPIEQRVTGALAASVGGVSAPTASVTLDTNSGTPATTPITTNELDAVTWAGAGAKTVTVTIPATLKGEAKVTV